MVKETKQGWFCSSQSSFGAAKMRFPPGEDIGLKVSKFICTPLFFLLNIFFFFANWAFAHIYQTTSKTL
jgi:hypothetical protein